MVIASVVGVGAAALVAVAAFVAGAVVSFLFFRRNPNKAAVVNATVNKL